MGGAEAGLATSDPQEVQSYWEELEAWKTLAREKFLEQVQAKNEQITALQGEAAVLREKLTASVRALEAVRAEITESSARRNMKGTLRKTKMAIGERRTDAQSQLPRLCLRAS